MRPVFLSPSCQFADQFETTEQNADFQFLGFPNFLCNYVQINSPTLAKEEFPFTKRAMMISYLLQNHTNFLLRRVIKDVPEDH